MEKKSQKNIGFVLLHGAGLGAWIWEDLISKLEYPCLAIDLPGRGRHADIATTNLSLDKYVESVLFDLNQFSPTKLIIVAHSISGIIGIEVANKLQDRIFGFIAISASIPSTNGSYISSLPFLTGLFLRVMFMFAGTRPPASVIQGGLCNDLDDKCTSKIINHFIPESKKLYTDKLRAQGIPDNSLYIHLKKDLALSEAIQVRMINNLHAKQVIDIDSGHLPMLSKPNELVQILNTFASSLI
jgi:pimeloyl-ACP methyl ester carboxylesterase